MPSRCAESFLSFGHEIFQANEGGNYTKGEERVFCYMPLPMFNMPPFHVLANAGRTPKGVTAKTAPRCLAACIRTLGKVATHQSMISPNISQYTAPPAIPMDRRAEDTQRLQRLQRCGRSGRVFGRQRFVRGRDGSLLVFVPPCPTTAGRMISWRRCHRLRLPPPTSSNEFTFPSSSDESPPPTGQATIVIVAAHSIPHPSSSSPSAPTRSNRWKA